MRRTLAVGALWGAFCGVARGWPVVITLVQMAVPWVWVAALVGWWLARTTREALLFGGVALLAANVAYFAVGALARGVAGDPLVGLGFLAVWGSIGLVVGPIAGLLGHQAGRRTGVGPVALLAAVSVAEPVALWAHTDHFYAHVAFLAVSIVGLAVPIVAFRRERPRMVKTMALVLASTYPTAVALEMVLIALAQVSPPMRLV